MAEQHTVFVRKTEDGDWSELSRHDERDDALGAMRAALISKEEPWTIARVDPGGELYVLTTERAIVEVMRD
jgi:hypothetical protein